LIIANIKVTHFLITMKLVHNQYQIDGLNVVDLCEKYGSPVYVYDTSKMKSQYEKMQHAFKDVSLKINFACKALGNINVLRFFNNLPGITRSGQIPR